MSDTLQRTRKVGMIECHECEALVELRQSKKGRLYYCCTEAGCGQQSFSRSLATDRRMAQRAKSWTDTTLRAELQAGPRVPPPAPPAPAPVPSPAPPPAPAPRKRDPLDSFFNS